MLYEVITRREMFAGEFHLFGKQCRAVGLRKLQRATGLVQKAGGMLVHIARTGLSVPNELTDIEAAHVPLAQGAIAHHRDVVVSYNFV